MVYWYSKGQASYLSPNFHMAFYIDMNGYDEVNYDSQDIEGEGESGDPFMAFGIDTQTWAYGQEQVEIGLLGSRRIRINSSGIYGWNGSTWENLISGGAGGNLGDLDDVVITTPADNEVLAYNNATSQWINQTPAEAGLAVSGHNHTHNDLTGLNDGDAYEHITQAQKNALHPEAHVLATTGPHTGTLPWVDLNKTGSSLADLVTRPHSGLSDAPTSAHHVRYADSEAIQAVEDTGLVLSATKVITSADESTIYTFGKQQLGHGGSGYAFFKFRGMGYDNYAVRQSSDGTTSINAADTKLIYFSIADIYKMRLYATKLDMSVGIDMNTNKITALGDGVNAQDAMAFGQKYTNAEVDARIVVQNTDPAGTIDIAIDTLIEAHKDLPNAHHTPPVAGDFAHNSLAGIDAGDIQHITVNQKNGLYTTYYVTTEGEFSSAITSIGTGFGTIVFNSATIVLTSALLVNGAGSYIIEGRGDKTVIDIGGNWNAFYITSAASCILRNFKIDATDLTSADKDIINIAEGSNNKVIVDNVTIVGDGTNGYGIVPHSDNCIVKGCRVSTVNYGIVVGTLVASSKYHVITKNKLYNNNSIGIRTNSHCDYIIITKNIIDGNSNTIFGMDMPSSDHCIINDNIVYNNTNEGIYIDGGDYNTCNGNQCYNNKYGITIRGDYNSIVGNNCKNNTLYGIYLFNVDYSAIVGNTCMLNNSNSTSDGGGIWIDTNSDYNSINGNVCYESTNIGAGTGYGININNADCNNNKLAGNILIGNDTNYSDSGTDTILLGDDTAYNESTWDGDLGTATKNAIRDKIELMETEIDGNCTTAEAIQAVEDTGLVLSATKVITSEDGDLSFTFGRCGIGSPVTDKFYIGHRDKITSLNYSLQQDSDGNTFLNAPTDRTIYFRINDATIMNMNASGLRIGGIDARITEFDTDVNLGGGDTKVPTDGAAKSYIDTQVATKCTTAEAHAYIEANPLTMENDIVMGSHKITGLTNGSAAQDAMAFGQKYTDTNAVAAVSAAGIDFNTTQKLGFADDAAFVFIDRIYDEDAMGSNDEHGLATQRSIKKYVDDNIIGGGFVPPVGFITMFSGTWVDNSTIPGWYKCDGNNGTPNLVNKFIRGAATSGGSGGSDDAVIISHRHGATTYTAMPNAEGGNNPGGLYGAQLGNTRYTKYAGVSGTGKNVPAYYALIFIMRVS